MFSSFRYNHIWRSCCCSLHNGQQQRQSYKNWVKTWKFITKSNTLIKLFIVSVQQMKTKCAISTWCTGCRMTSPWRWSSASPLDLLTTTGKTPMLTWTTFPNLKQATCKNLSYLKQWCDPNAFQLFSTSPRSWRSQRNMKIFSYCSYWLWILSCMRTKIV